MSRIAITGGTGFVGRHLAARLTAAGHEVVVVARGVDRRVPVPAGPRITVVDASVVDAGALARAFEGCDAVVHCAGINRELGLQTYEAIHVGGTRAVADAARSAGVGRLVMLSFLRARPDGPSTYHRSKWAAEEIVRGSGVSYTILKAGVIHGRGDHMLDHLSRAFHSFPVFGLVGLRERPVRPVAVDDVARILEAAALGDPRLSDRTIAVLGPEELTLGAAVRRVATVTGRRPIFVRLPVAAHRLLAIVLEAVMTIPLIARAQVEILAEGIVDPLPFADEPPADLAPRTPFSEEVIRDGLPPAGGFGRADLRWCVKPV
jgi:NADH dehydrogenase